MILHARCAGATKGLKIKTKKISGAIFKRDIKRRLKLEKNLEGMSVSSKKRSKS